MDEGHLVDDVESLVHGIANALDPIEEVLASVASGNLEDRLAQGLVLLEATRFMGIALVDQNLRQRAQQTRRHGEFATLDPSVEGQVVRAAQPGGDL